MSHEYTIIPLFWALDCLQFFVVVVVINNTEMGLHIADFLPN